MRLILIAVVFTLAVHAQQKKIVALNANPTLVEQLQSATPEARIVPVERANMMNEIGDADGYIGEITSTEVRAGKNLKWVGVMSAGVERVLFPADGTSDLRDSKIVLTNNKIVQGPEI